LPFDLCSRLRAGAGRKLYYPIVILLKWPRVALVLSMTGLALALGRRLNVPVVGYDFVFLGLAILARFILERDTCCRCTRLPCSLRQSCGNGSGESAPVWFSQCW
jgi:hypothetical protein